MGLSKLAYRGEAFSIEFYMAADGACPAMAWLEKQSPKIHHKFAALFVMFGNVGKIFNEQKFKHLTGTEQLFEFKAGQGRIICFFFVGKRVILTNGFLKKSDSTPKGEILRAHIMKNDFFARSKK